MRAFAPEFSAEMATLLDPRRGLETREIPGGTGPKAVAAALARGQAAAERDGIMTKTYRQGQILKLVRGKGIKTQEELAQELKSQGIAATQVTLSRDIRDLRLVKTREGYKEIADEEPGPQFSLLAAEFLHDVLRAQNLVVLKTSPGHAKFGCGRTRRRELA